MWVQNWRNSYTLKTIFSKCVSTFRRQTKWVHGVETLLSYKTYVIKLMWVDNPFISILSSGETVCVYSREGVLGFPNYILIAHIYKFTIDARISSSIYMCLLFCNLVLDLNNFTLKKYCISRPKKTFRYISNELEKWPYVRLAQTIQTYWNDADDY